MLGSQDAKPERGGKGGHDHAAAQGLAPFRKAGHQRQRRKPGHRGTAVIKPIQDASIPIAFNQTVKNGRCVPTIPNSVP